MNPRKFNTVAWICDKCGTAHLRREAALECCRVVPCIRCGCDIPSPEYAEHRRCQRCRIRTPRIETHSVEEYHEQLVHAVGADRWRNDVVTYKLVSAAVDVYRQLLRAESTLHAHDIATPRQEDAEQFVYDARALMSWLRGEGES